MIEKRVFGRTGHQSSVTLFGGAALGNVTQAQADRALDVLLDHGVNHIDVAASYGDAELRLGPWLPGLVASSSWRPRPASAAYQAPARTSGGRSTGSTSTGSTYPAAQPGRPRRLGARPRPWRRHRGLRRSAGRGAGPVHRGHRPRAVRTGHAPSQPRTLRLRLGSPPVQLRDDAKPKIRRRFRGLDGDFAGKGRWRCRPSSPSLGGGGATTRTRARHGTSHLKIRPRLTGRCIGS